MENTAKVLAFLRAHPAVDWVLHPSLDTHPDHALATRLLPHGAGLVNIGRGELLDQDALCDLLDGGNLSGAVLDVFTPEPIPPGHRLWSTRNLIISPHTAADDPATYNPRSLDLFLDNLRAWRDNKPLPNRFDTMRGY